MLYGICNTHLMGSQSCSVISPEFSYLVIIQFKLKARVVRASLRAIMTQLSVAVSTAGTSTIASNVAATTTTTHRGAAAIAAEAGRSRC
jgi:hypothetical protein